MVFCAFLNSCVQVVETIFFPVPWSKATFIFQAKTSGQPRGPWCAQNKFNICHRIKWLCSPANEKSQTFENCLATLPERKKLSVTSFSRRFSLSIPPFLSVPLTCPFRFLFSISILLFLFLSLTFLFFIHMYWISSPFLATESKLICFTERNGWYSSPRSLLSLLCWLLAGVQLHCMNSGDLGGFQL